jgi:hypothetical protein
VEMCILTGLHRVVDFDAGKVEVRSDRAARMSAYFLPGTHSFFIGIANWPRQIPISISKLALNGKRRMMILIGLNSRHVPSP